MCPADSMDGKNPLDSVFDSAKKYYNAKLYDYAVMLLKAVRKCFAYEQIFGKILDKLDLHRIFELVVFTEL